MTAVAVAAEPKYGYCANGDGRPAAHSLEGKHICRGCLPKHIIFAPFLGPQANFMSRTERYVLFGGGAGPGKTDCALRDWIKQWTAEHARWVNGEIEQSVGWAIYFRRQLPELAQSIERFKTFYKKLDPGAVWNEQSKICTFSCGYKVQFAGMEHAGDWEKFYGPEYTWICFDEATQFTVEQIEQMDTRLRCSDPVLGKMLALRLVTNPVGAETKLYLRNRYVEAADPGKVVRIRTKLRDGRVIEERQVYIPANIYDNPAILEDGKYEANLLRKTAAVRRALLDNDWYVDASSWVGEDWDPTIHITAPFPIPAGWFRFKSGDYGFSSNSSIQWWAVDTEGNMVCYRSLTVKGHTAEELGFRIREIEREPLIVNGVKIVDAEWDRLNGHSTVWGPMDSSLWARVGESGPSRGEMLDNIGCGFFKADRGPGSRKNAAEQMRNRLRRRTPNAKGDLVIPGIRWFSSCKSIRRDKDGRREETGPVITIPILQCDENDPDVPDTDGDDHDWDAAAYGCQYRPIVPESDEGDPNVQFYDELQARRTEKTTTGAVSGWPGGY